MTPPHAPFNYLFRNHMLLNSRHSLDRAEAQRSPTESVSPVPEGSLVSLERSQPTIVDGFNRSLQPKVLPVSCVDCDLSRSDSSYFSKEQSTGASVASFERRGSEPRSTQDFTAGELKEDYAPRHDVDSTLVSLSLRHASLPSLSFPHPSSDIPDPSSPVHTSFPTLTLTSSLISPMISAISSATNCLTPSASLNLEKTSLTSSGEMTPDATFLSSMTTDSTHTVSTHHTVPVNSTSRITSTPLTTTETKHETTSIPTSRITSTPLKTTETKHETTSISTSRITSTPPLTTTETNTKSKSEHHTSLLSSTSTAHITSSSPSPSCLTSTGDMSDCPAAVSGYPSGSNGLSKSSIPCADCSSSLPFGTAHVNLSSTITTTIMISSHSVLSTISSTDTVVVSSAGPVSTPTNANSDTQTNSPKMGAIAGGAIGVVAILGILLYIVMRSRSRKTSFVTPFDLPPPAGPPLDGTRNLKYRSRIVRPSSAASDTSFIQYSDAPLGEFEPMSACPSCMMDASSSFISMSDEGERRGSPSTIARQNRNRELEKLYPFPSHTRTTRDHSGENWVEQMIAEDSAQEPSEELPAYPRSAKSLKSISREADGNGDGDGYFVLPSSYPSLPERMHL